MRRETPVGATNVMEMTPFLAGASGDGPFVFDNEKWCHPVEVRPFRIARAPVTNAGLAAFVDDGGHARREHRTGAGRR